jgi:apolipoprotein N-acyltransferase
VGVVDAARSNLAVGLPWALLGHSQAGISGVAQLAVTAGVPGISALLASINAALVVALGQKGEGRRPAWAIAAAGAYLALALFGASVTDWGRPSTLAGQQAVRILMVQPNIPVGERWVERVQRTNLGIVARLTEGALSGATPPVDLVVWPETTLTSAVDLDPKLDAALLEWVDRLDTPVILGVARSDPAGSATRYRNSVLWIDPDGTTRATFDKERAIPLIEAAGDGGVRRFASRLLGLERLERFVAESDGNAIFGHDPTFSIALCFEALYPNILARRREENSAAILNLANDSWFANEIPSQQQRTYVSFRAIEQRQWLLRVAHGGISAIVDPWGRIAAELPFDTSGTLIADVHPTPQPTSRERWALGGLVVTGGGVGFVATPFVSRRRTS